MNNSQLRLELNHLKTREFSLQGITIGLTIIGLWFSSLIFLLSLDLSKIQSFWIFSAIVFQMFLYTGLFITAHDAMHGSLFPQNPQLNHFIGSLALSLYALFPYQKLIKSHWLHHQYPARELDPDFYTKHNQHPVFWYCYFMKKYCNWLQILTLMSLFYLIVFCTSISAINLLLFWVVPSLLSSVQLFYFGVFLPHREPAGGYTNPHHAQSHSLSPFWSFLTCYHFGYHEEHHEYPYLPWWQLPTIRK
jgi:beta-carotene ketolase (CrtW type)